MPSTTPLSMAPQDGRLLPPDPIFPMMGGTIFPTRDSITLCLYLPKGLNCSRVHVSFRMRVIADGELATTMQQNRYTNVRVLHANGEVIDYGLAFRHWDRLNFDADVTENEGRPCVLLTIMHANGLQLDLTKPQFKNDALPTTPLLGGATLTQLVAARRLGMGYVLTAPEGQTVMIDGGRDTDVTQIEELLLERGGHVSDWFLTHYHSDHIGALIELLKKDSDIRIDHLYYDFDCDPAILEQRGGREATCITALEEAIAASGKVGCVVKACRGLCVERGGLRIKALNNAYWGNFSEICNDSSVVYKVETPQESILFLGDLYTWGSVLLEDPDFLEEVRQCMIVQMAHHGQEGVDEHFYRELTAMRICLYPAQQWLFDCDKGEGLGSGLWESLNTRAWIRETDVRKSYSMIDGRVTLQ